MKCNRCGQINPINARNCIYCNAPINSNYYDENLPKKIFENPTVDKNIIPPNGKKSKGELALVSIISSLIVVVAITIGIFIFSPEEDRGVNFSSSYTASNSFPSTNRNPDETPVPEESADNNETPSTDSDNSEENSENGSAPSESTQTGDDSDKDSIIRQKQKEIYELRAEKIEQEENNFYETAMTQSELNSGSAEIYSKWDLLLNEVYQYLKSILPEDDFKVLQDDEQRWVAEKEAAIEEAGQDWEGGSGEPMARNCAGIKYTKKRCYYLISLIN